MQYDVVNLRKMHNYNAFSAAIVVGLTTANKYAEPCKSNKCSGNASQANALSSHMKIQALESFNKRQQNIVMWHFLLNHTKSIFDIITCVTQIAEGCVLD